MGIESTRGFFIIHDDGVYSLFFMEMVIPFATQGAMGCFTSNGEKFHKQPRFQTGLLETWLSSPGMHKEIMLVTMNIIIMKVHHSFN